MKTTIAIPIHKKLNDEEIKFFERCLESVKKYKPIVFCTNENKTQFVKYKITTIINDKETDYPSMVNFIANNVLSDFVTIVEFDDVITKEYIENVEEHIKAYTHIDMFVPIVHDTTVDDKFLALKNNIAWSFGQMDEMGYFSFEQTKNTLDFSLVAATYRTSVLKQIPFRTKIPLYFDKEYLLRFLNMGHICYVIPKIGVKHTQLRPNSYYDLNLKNYTKNQRKNILSVIRRECLFNEDRPIEF